MTSIDRAKFAPPLGISVGKKGLAPEGLTLKDLLFSFSVFVKKSNICDSSVKLGHSGKLKCLYIF